MLDFEPEGMKKLHFFDTGLEHIIVIASYADQEVELMNHMEELFQTVGFTLEQIVEWCQEQELAYQIIKFSDIADDGYEGRAGN